MTVPSTGLWIPSITPSWRHRFHSLDFLWPAIHAGRVDETKQIIDDWVESHPIDDAGPVWAADTTAKRTQLMACVQHLAPSQAMATALKEHGRRLASDEFYVGHHNHGISQDIALLITGCVIEEEWMIEHAEGRIAAALAVKIDDEGKVDEQAPAYQEYVIGLYRRYEELADICPA